MRNSNETFAKFSVNKKTNFDNHQQLIIRINIMFIVVVCIQVIKLCYNFYLNFILSDEKQMNYNEKLCYFIVY